MKVAVLADIHSNLPAVQEVCAHIESWRPDRVIMAGDVVNRGPFPLECLRIIQDKQRTDGWRFVRGNHEDYVLDQARPDAPRSGPRFDISRNAYWTLQQLDGQVADLAAMPFQVSFPGPDGKEFRVVHASMQGNRDGIYPETSEQAIRQLIAPPPAVLCVGHTHRPLIRRIENTLVVNVGSVGTPFDGDRRASYAQLSWRDDGWQADIVRLDYDIVQAERDYFDTQFIAQAGGLAGIMFVEFRLARSLLFKWAATYQDKVLAGELTVRESVRDYLDQLDADASIKMIRRELGI